jgi:glutamine amidotransferase
MIAIIDYGMGNLKSVTNAFRKLDATVEITRDRRIIEGASAMVLPGVGAFGKCIANLKEFGLFDVVKEWIKADRLYLGICLGMQILFDSSEESPGVGGLGVIGGRVPRFAGTMKVPHMGWNSLHFTQEPEIFRGIREGEFFYFVHSYYCAPDDESVVATKTPYGIDFVSSIKKGNLFACQFHPEKSQKVGLQVLQNFIGLCR